MSWWGDLYADGEWVMDATIPPVSPLGERWSRSAEPPDALVGGFGVSDGRLYGDGETVYARPVMPSTVDQLPHTIRPLGEVPPADTLAILAGIEPPLHVVDLLESPHKIVFFPRLHGRSAAMRVADVSISHMQATAPTVQEPADQTHASPRTHHAHWFILDVNEGRCECGEPRPTTDLEGSGRTESSTPNT